MQGLAQHLVQQIAGADGYDIAIHDISPPPRVVTMPLPPLDPHAPAPLNPPPGAKPVLPPSPSV